MLSPQQIDRLFEVVHILAREVSTELEAAGWDEVCTNPILHAKYKALVRCEKTVERLLTLHRPTRRGPRLKGTFTPVNPSQ